MVPGVRHALPVDGEYTGGQSIQLARPGLDVVLGVVLKTQIKHNSISLLVLLLSVSTQNLNVPGHNVSADVVLTRLGSLDLARVLRFNHKNEVPGTFLVLRVLRFNHKNEVPGTFLVSPPSRFQES